MNLFDLSAVLTLDTSQYERGIDDAKRSTKGLDDSIDGTQGTLGRAEKGFTVFKGVLSNVISGGVNALANAITSNLGGAISRVDTLNNYSIVMQNLGHNAKESQKAIDTLVEGIDGLPTTLDGIASVQQQFVALGGSMEDATKLTLALNNATLAGGQGQEKANSAMAQWYQMIAAGKPDLMSMRIINEAMPAQLDAIAKSVIGADANWQDLNAQWQKNPEITQKVKDAIVQLNEEGLNGTAGFAQQAKDATQGIQTSMQNMQTAIKNGIANIIQEIGTDKIATGFAVLKDAIKASFGEIVEFIQETKKFGIGEAITNEIFDARIKVWEAFAKLMDVDWASVFSTAFQNLGSAFKSVFDIALDINTLETDLINRMRTVGLEMMMGFIDSIIQNGEGMIEQGINVVTNFVAGIYENSARVVECATDLINKFIDYLSKNSDKIATSAVSMVIALGKGIVMNAPKILASVSKLGLAITKGIIRIVPKIPPLAVRMVTALAGALIRGVGRVGNAAKGLASRAVSSLQSGFAKVGDIGMNIVRGIASGITRGIGFIKSVITSFVGNVKSFLKRLFKIGSPSKWARDEIGKMIDKGLANGISDNADLIDDAMDEVVPDLEKNRFSLTSDVPANGNTKITSPVFNTNVSVDGAENPEEWGTRFANALEMKVRLA